MNATWIDGHVHFYPRFGLNSFLDAALRNFRKAGLDGGVGVLLMAQSGADQHPLALIQRRIAECSDGWTCRATETADGMLFCCNDHPSLVLIAGRQIVTCERLEVLALCTAERIAPGQSLGESIRQIRQAGGVPVLPWGLGKWWFRRGEIVRNLLSSLDATDGVLLGDHGGRGALFGGSGHFRLGEARGIAVLAGTDPLDVPGQEARIGCFGNVLDEALDLDRPVPWMRDRLLGLAESPPKFGTRRGAGGFLADQIRLRLRVT